MKSVSDIKLLKDKVEDCMTESIQKAYSKFLKDTGLSCNNVDIHIEMCDAIFTNQSRVKSVRLKIHF